MRDVDDAKVGIRRSEFGIRKYDGPKAQPYISPRQRLGTPKTSKGHGPKVQRYPSPQPIHSAGPSARLGSCETVPRALPGAHIALDLRSVHPPDDHWTRPGKPDSATSAAEFRGQNFARNGVVNSAFRIPYSEFHRHPLARRLSKYSINALSNCMLVSKAT